MASKIKSLGDYKVNKYNEVNYIKRFINGVSKKEIEEMFKKHLLEGFISILIGNELLKNRYWEKGFFRGMHISANCT